MKSERWPNGVSHERAPKIPHKPKDNWHSFLRNKYSLYILYAEIFLIQPYFFNQLNLFNKIIDICLAQIIDIQVTA